MKKILIILTCITIVYGLNSCKKDKVSENTKLLTAHIWTASSLLADGIDEGGEGGFLEIFNGDTKFNEDGTGYVGGVIGTWRFENDEKNLIISSDSLLFPVSTTILELTEISLKLGTEYPRQVEPLVYADVEMSFIPK